MSKVVYVYTNWYHHCGWCGFKRLVGVTAKHILVCSGCGRW